MGWLDRTLIASMIFTLTACGGQGGTLNSAKLPSNNNQSSDQPSAPPIEEDDVGSARWEAAGKDARQWTLYAYKEIENSAPDLVNSNPEDIADFCPAYASLPKPKKKNFWVYLLSSISEFESNFNPDESYTEDFADSTGARVVSRGLLQLSYESSLAYGCPLKKATDLHNPQINIACGLKILNRWVKSDKVIRGNANGWKGAARYWSVLRRQNQFDSIRSWTKLLNFCH